MQPMLDAEQQRPRDALSEQRERMGFEILERIYALASGKVAAPVHGMRVATDLELSREEAFRGIQFLTLREYLDYMGAGPQVALTRKAVHYLEQGAGRRRSVRG